MSYITTILNPSIKVLDPLDPWGVTSNFYEVCWSGGLGRRRVKAQAFRNGVRVWALGFRV